MQAICKTLTLQHGPTPEVLGRLIEYTGAAANSSGKPEELKAIAERVRAEYSAQHPLVCTHPDTGEEILYLSERFALNVVGMSAIESQMFLGYLNNLMDEPNHQVRWRWRKHDLAIWDEVLTNHRALSDHYPQHRLMRRTTVGTGAPRYMTAATNAPIRAVA
jgi:taurine dioxygenase